MDIRKLQRAIVDGLEDVKGHDIVVFNTEHLSPLFERVIIASGTSNRQTKALASSVRDAVKAHGERVLGVEGEDNGEWIIVDCGAAVAHIMQPAIRDYYRLEEIWGGKPVRMKLGAVVAKGLPKASESADTGDDDERPRAGKGAQGKAAKAAKTGAKSGAKKPGSPATKRASQSSAKPAPKPAGKTAAKPAGKAAPKPASKAAPKAAPKATPKSARKAPARAGSGARSTAGTAARKVVVAPPRARTASSTARPARKTGR